MRHDRPACLLGERPLGDTVVVTLGGEIDALDACGLSRYLDGVTNRERPDVVLDLRQVSFIDCGGLSSLVRVRRRVIERSGRVRLVCDDPMTLRVLRITDLSRHFDILDDIPAR